jgi:predicted nucleic acid-binding protein
VSVLLDTNIVSELSRRRPDPQVLEWASGVKTVALSVITLEEVFFGLALRRNSRVERWFEAFLDIGCRVVEVTAPIAKHAGVLCGQLAARGRARAQPDMLIAATAAVHGLTLATRNERDFEDCGVSVINPFS